MAEGRPTKKRRGRGRPRDPELVARRREEILAVASNVFAACGYPKTDVQQVADEVGVGKGTVYRYFPTKETLFLAAVDRGVRRLQETIEAAAETARDPLDRIAFAIEAYLGFFDVEKDLLELLMLERAHFKDRGTPTYFAHKKSAEGPWIELLEALQAAGRVREVPAARITSVLSNLLYGTIFTHHFTGDETPLRERAADALEIVFLGLLTEPERRARQSPQRTNR